MTKKRSTPIYPHSAADRVIMAKSIVQAALAAHDAGALADANYDIHYPLSLVVELLEGAAQDME